VHYERKEECTRDVDYDLNITVTSI
jgi:hypothetical protein